MPFLFGQIVEHAFQTLFKLSAELGTGDQRAHVQRQQAFVFQTLWHFAIDNTLCETFDNRGFTDTRLTNQHRIVLGTALQT